jgi:hypothetical protein
MQDDPPIELWRSCQKPQGCRPVPHGWPAAATLPRKFPTVDRVLRKPKGTPHFPSTHCHRPLSGDWTDGQRLAICPVLWKRRRPIRMDVQLRGEQIVVVCQSSPRIFACNSRDESLSIYRDFVFAFRSASSPSNETATRCSEYCSRVLLMFFVYTLMPFNGLQITPNPCPAHLTRQRRGLVLTVGVVPLLISPPPPPHGLVEKTMHSRTIPQPRNVPQ